MSTNNPTFTLIFQIRQLDLYHYFVTLLPIPEHSLVEGYQCPGGVPIVHRGDPFSQHCVSSLLVNPNLFWPQPIQNFLDLLCSGITATLSSNMLHAVYAALEWLRCNMR